MAVRARWDCHVPVTLELPPSSGARVEMALEGHDDSRATAIYDSAAALLAAKYDVTVWYHKAPGSEHVTSCIWRQSGRA